MAETNGSGHDGTNGASRAPADGERPPLPPPPPEIAELASACVRFVEQALGVRLDFSADTLSVLDHYLGERRRELREQPAAAALVFRAAGAYFGEVVRRRHDVWWHVPSDDPNDWTIQARAVFLSFRPVAVVYDAIFHGEGDGPIASLEVEDEDREQLAERLAELPAADDEEFFSLATRLEVIDIAVDAIKARMMGSGLGDVEFGPDDYDDD